MYVVTFIRICRYIHIGISTYIHMIMHYLMRDALRSLPKRKGRKGYALDFIACLYTNTYGHGTVRTMNVIPLPS